MPIRDLQKKRAYQREWAARKAEGKAKISRLSPRGSDEAEISGATWEECTRKAIEINPHLKKNRFLVASLALKACKVQWGGDRRDSPNPYNLKRFALAIGLQPKSLHDWAQAKRLIVDHLPPEIEWIDYGAAELALANSRKTKLDPVLLYKKYSSPNSPERSALHCARAIRLLNSHLETHGINGLEKRDVEGLKDLTTLFNKKLKGAKDE